jgi:hypothetical protein
MKRIKKAGRLALSVFALSLVAYVSRAQVGIGTELPQAKLHVHDGSALFTYDKPDPAENPFYDASAPEPIQYRAKWFHDKGAFRVLNEEIINQGFDISKIGKFSFASGFEVEAQGVAALAAGMRTSASGIASTAIGYNTVASGIQSFASGAFAQATGDRSVALGTSVSTNNMSGSFVFGDYSGSTQNDANNQMMMRFTGGYKLYSNANSSVGVLLTPNSNSWSSISDVNKKENFAPVNGDDFLNKIASMKLTSWNYKGQDAKAFRHYGPMAQDFYKAFGHDEYGTIGTDTTINQADFDGVNLIAIQALVRRMEKMNSDLLLEIAAIKAQLAAVQRVPDSRKSRVLISKK